MSIKRKNIFSGTEWEPLVGYCRAVRVGNQIWISGTTATDKTGELVGRNSVYEQTTQTLKNIEAALAKAGARMQDVVRTRIYVTNIDEDWQDVGRAHKGFFEGITPATSMVEVSRLINSDMKVEIEAVAMANSESINNQ